MGTIGLKEGLDPSLPRRAHGAPVDPDGRPVVNGLDKWTRTWNFEEPSGGPLPPALRSSSRHRRSKSLDSTRSASPAMASDALPHIRSSR